MPLIELPSKPGAPLHYDLLTNPSDMLIVFINGLGLPSESWSPTCELVQDSPTLSKKPSFLMYDRFGQGQTTSRDPRDASAEDPAYGHDVKDAAADLDELLQTLGLKSRKLIFVSASIGVHIARLQDQVNPGVVSAHIMLDSNPGTIEYTEVWPDPETPDFAADQILGDDFSLEQYQTVRAKLGMMFGSQVKNREGLDRRNVMKLLPTPSSPALRGPGGKSPFLAVVGHEPEAFADENVRMLGIPPRLTELLTQPPWEEYNRGLLKLGEPGRVEGVLYAPGCGHFIQKDNPQWLAKLIEETVIKAQNEN